MTRIKKYLVAGLMAVITLCVSIGSALVNISQSLFSWIQVSAATTDYSYSNTNNGGTYKNGNILQISNIPTKGYVNSNIEIPRFINKESVDPSSRINVFGFDGAIKTEASFETIVDIRTPYGDKLVYTDTTTGDNAHTAGKIIDANQVTTNSTSYVLHPTQVGVYTVQYAVKNADGVWTISEIYSIQVTKEAYSLELTTNDPIVLPTQIDTNQGVETLVKLPLPKVYDEKGNQITKFVLGKESNEFYYVAEYKNLGGGNNVVVLDENNIPHVYDYSNEEERANINANEYNTYDSYSTYTVTKLSVADVEADANIKYGLYVEAYNAETTVTVSNFKTGTEEEASLKLNYSGTGEQFYIADAYSFTAGSGKNIVRYRLCNKNLSDSSSPISYLPDITIEGTTNLNKNDISLGASTTTNIVYSDTSLKDKCYLPKVSAVDKNNNSNALNAYYYYKVRYIGNLSDSDTSNDNVANGMDNEYVTLGQDEKGLYFIPKVKGTYNIYYNAKDFYGNTDENADKYDYDVVVTDRVAPTLQLTKSYDFDNVNESIVSDDYSYVLPTKYYTNPDETDVDKMPKIVIPAIYTTDSVLDFSDLTVTRTITSEDGFKNISTYNKTEKNYNISIQSSTGETTYNVTVKDENGDNLVLKNIVSFDPVVKGTYTNFYIKIDDVEDSSTKDNAAFYNNNDEKMPVTSSETLQNEQNKLAFKKAKTSQVAYIRLDPRLFGEGKYTIKFNVSDKNGSTSNNTGDTFTFELVYSATAEEVDNEAPTVEFKDDAIVDVEKDQTITLNKPTVKDNVDTGASKTSSRKITLDRYYILIQNKTAVLGNINTFVELKPNEDGKLSFNMSDIAVGTDTIYDLANKVGNFKVVCFSYDDFADYSVNPAIDFANLDFSDFEANTGIYKNIGYGEIEITVKNVTDPIAPKFWSRTTAVADDQAYEQYAVVKVNGIVFYDNTATDKISVKVLDSQGNSYDYEELDSTTVISKVEKLTSDGLTTEQYQALVDAGYAYKYTLSGIKFTANRADNYTINYTITDEGNNVTSYAYVLTLAIDQETPVITEIVGITDSMELGTSKKFVVSATDNTEHATISYMVKVLDQDGRNVSFSYFNNETMTFTPLATGTYTVQIQADDGFGNVSSAQSFTVKVSDTIGPELRFDNLIQDVISIAEKAKDASVNSNGDTVDWKKVFPEVELSGFTVTDTYQTNSGFTGVFGATGTLTIKTPDNNSYSITNTQTTIEGENPLNIKREGTKFLFTPTERGEYTIVYSGKDNSGNVATNEKTIKVTVGDTEKPVVKLSDSLLNTLKEGFIVDNDAQLLINTKVLFDNATDMKQSKTNGDVYLTDNYGFKNLGDGEEGSEVYTDVSVQVLDANNNSVSYTTETNQATGVEYKKFEFTTAGTYTINFTATDSVGNSYTLAKTFKVSAVETSSSESSKVLGIVLIVVSIVILAGVIIYFVRGTKFLPKRKKVKKDKVQKEDDKD